MAGEVVNGGESKEERKGLVINSYFLFFFIVR